MTRVRLFAMTLAVVLLVVPAFCQQEKGDKEIGIGGQMLFTHTSDFIGNASFQFSLGYFASKTNYFGFEVDPTVTFTHISGKSSTDVGGAVGANYRRFVATSSGKVFPFVGAGGGAYIATSGGNTSTLGAVFGEGGLKSYISQKTSLEFAYKLLYLPSGEGSFREKSISLITISIRHIF